MKTNVKNYFRNILLRIGFGSNPDFIIIGAQKAGTTGLNSILKKHSNIMGFKKKEIHYFDNDNWYSKNKIYTYQSYFPLSFRVSKKTKLFEATPEYLFHPAVAERLYKYSPNIKLIALLRNPAERAFSAWTMYHHHFKVENRYLHDPRSFTEAINQELYNLDKPLNSNENRYYIKRGIYYNQIKNYYEYFSKDQILLIESNQLKFNFDETIKEIQSFIEVPYENLSFIKSHVSRVSEKDKYKKDIEKLKKFYKPYNQKLFELIGEEFNWND